MVMDLDRQFCREISIVDVLSSHLAFTCRVPTRSCIGSAQVNPTGYSSVVQRDESVGSRPSVVWFVGCGRLAG
jgi:hypothetical protein